MIKGSLHQEGLTVLNLCAPNNRASNYIKQKHESEIDKSTVIPRDFNNPLNNWCNK